jgi:hypothetical protein
VDRVSPAAAGIPLVERRPAPRRAGAVAGCRSPRSAVGCSVASTRRPTRRFWTPWTTLVLLPDVNVLLAGFRADHDHHRRTRTFLEEARSASEMLGVSDFALASVVRPTRAYSYDRTTPTRSSSTSMCCSIPGQLLRAGSTLGRASASSAGTYSCAATSCPTPTSPRSRSSKGPSSSRSTAASDATRASAGAACSTTSETTDPSGSIMALPPPSEVVVESGGQVALEVQAVRVGEHRVEPGLPLEGAPPRSRMNETRERRTWPTGALGH